MITLCSSCEKIKQNRAKFEQEEFENDINVLKTMFDMFLDKNENINTDIEALPNKTIKMTTSISHDMNNVDAMIAFIANLSEKEYFITQMDIFEKNYSIRNEITHIYKWIITQYGNVVYENEVIITPDDLSANN
jgi:hypothetical protein